MPFDPLDNEPRDPWWHPNRLERLSVFQMSLVIIVGVGILMLVTRYDMHMMDKVMRDWGL